LPLAVVGGVLAALAFTGEITPLGSLVGLFAVLGIAVRNAVLLTRHLQRLQWEEGEELGPGLILRGTRERLAPMVLTALTTGIALLPLMLFGGVPGLEVVRPLAAVILGGLLTSTLVGVLLVPFLYLRFAPRTQPEEAAAELSLSPVSS
jgi:Cu/Ag efflux pump CusA